MHSLSTILSVAHLVGLALGVGAATVKLVLLVRCRIDPAVTPLYIWVAAPVTRQIVLGMILLTLSGIGWLLLGHPFTALLAVKLVLVAGIWVLGPIIDNVVEPRFRRLAPEPGETASPAFLRVQREHLALEIAATALFYAVIIVWVRG